MKLIRFGELNNEKPGVQLADTTKIDVSEFGEDYTEQFFETDGLNRLEKWLNENQSSCKVLPENTRLGSPIARPSKLVCVGLNYAKHAAESGMDLPKEPVLFFKATSSIVGPYDTVVIPKGSTKTDWEVELAVVIGKKASYVSESEALDYVAGYVLHNDVSERAFQLEREGQWVKGKSCDTFAPLGPFLATKDEVKDPNNLHLWLKLNGKTMQDSTTSDLVFNIQEVVSYISQFMTLLPGDVISTGTPFGVGLGLKPPLYLKQGDVMELGVEGLGISKQEVVAYENL
ncbi:fumarylacetoacetate hydrolase family protein [Leeuwenhoekiella marinoflava]|uniref:2-keto-4-pentenoate hydratase/2-oxohepta-3-ene-1,7-dioic acid hydratase in catechol pathway n=2 Tax=Leeuwenhoekiella marinoflava TaxID=988 RepID=A0A4Q0PP12_9FLAO|nr:fumarylacetoacetate hydrolase family protein [Leeuwenhoekiella marinoflava]RXG32184.1 2-keto-4-pentenoate hydratase/2-oxohepta-3-ene-1,7-dioic acid hydratase in catechol pathway [Leeuwenhoekiella marinoflava]SHE84193.1 2-keto-4-pentenoate hydratase/2-oxohepta-3-ene-1,7-dioic acid hydratase (catechol pathway) [Leeuwenhoekiella marinoflava DSM 3653]